MNNRRYKAVVFDLDDTLFNTFETCVRPAAKESCLAMVEAGLNCTVQECVLEREAFFTRFPRKDMYPHIVNKFGIRKGSNMPADEVISIGRKAFHSRDVEAHIKPFPLVTSVLADLKTRYLLFLVTTGDPKTQNQKIDILKIRKFFNHVFCMDTSKQQRKTLAFLEILRHTQLKGQEILCVGDRLDREIAEAKQLSFDTCHVRRGQYTSMLPILPEENPDYTVQDVSELIATCKL